MADGEHKIRLANGEFDASQQRKTAGNTEFDLVGTLIFRAPAQITCSFGTISLGVREARLIVAYENCRIPQRDLGYVRSMPDKVVAERKEQTSTESNHRWKLWGKADTSAGASLGGEGGIGGSRAISSATNATTQLVRYLVSAEGVDPDKREASWIIRSLNRDERLEGEVFGDEEFGGRLGRVQAAAAADWIVQPRLDWMPTAEILGREQLDLAQRGRFERELRNKQSLAAIVLSEDRQFAHKDFEPVVPRPQPGTDE